MLAHEINYLITANLDTALLTIFSSLKVVSVYALYSLLYGMITRVLMTIRGAFEFKIAHEFHRSRSTFLRLFEAYEVCYITLATSLIAIASCFMLPFLRLYTAGITDVNYIDPFLLPLFALVFLFAAGRYPSDAMVHISGHFQQTRNSATAETVINLIVSIVCVQFWGIHGALIGTIVSSLYRTIYLIAYVNKYVIRRSSKNTYLCWGVNLVLLLITGYAGSLLPVSLNTYFKVFAFCIPYSIVVLSLFFGINLAFNHSAAKSVFYIINQMIRRK